VGDGIDDFVGDVDAAVLAEFGFVLFVHNRKITVKTGVSQGGADQGPLTQPFFL
jgi:hypothetical protein